MDGWVDVLHTAKNFKGWKGRRLFCSYKMKAVVANLGGIHSSAYLLLCCYLVSFVEGGRSMAKLEINAD